MPIKLKEKRAMDNLKPSEEFLKGFGLFIFWSRTGSVRPRCSTILCYAKIVTAFLCSGNLESVQ
jgi:hypothetical protein